MVEGDRDGWGGGVGRVGGCRNGRDGCWQGLEVLRLGVVRVGGGRG